MALPLSYNAAHLAARAFSSTLTVVFVAAVVAAFCWMMGLARGINQSLEVAGDPRNLIVKAKGADSESSSTISPEEMAPLTALPYLEQVGQEPRSGISYEVVAFAQISRRGDPDKTLTNIAVRGIEPEETRYTLPQVKLVEGRWFTSAGAKEIVVGRAASERFAGIDIGDKFQLGFREDDLYEVVGIFETQDELGRRTSAAFESEIWGYASYIKESNRRTQFSVARLRTAVGITDAERAELISRINGPGIALDAQPEPDYYKSLAIQATFFQVLATLLAVFMGLGAVFAIMNTMYGAVAGRMREIGTLRAIGFPRGSILLSFMIESITVCFIGGLAGCLIAMYLINGVRQDTLSQNFTSLAFRISVGWDLLLISMAVALVVGVVGSMLPAIRASRMNVINALKSVE